MDRRSLNCRGLLILLLLSLLIPLQSWADRFPYGVDANTVALWSFNRDQGALVVDEAQDHDGNAIGESTLVVGKFPRARSFRGQGQGDYIEIPDYPTLDGFTELTLEAWVLPISFDLSKWNGQESLIIKGGHDHITGHPLYELSVIRNNGPGDSAAQFETVRFGMQVSIWDGPAAQAHSEVTHVPGRWYYVVGTYDGNRARIYVNGSLEAESPEVPGIVIDNDDPLFINNHSFFSGSRSQGRLGGIIDEVRLSDIARSAEEIRQTFELSRFKLQFPLIGLTAYSAEISAVFDHSMTTGANCADSVVVAYTGEEGLADAGVSEWFTPSPSSVCLGQELHGCRSPQGTSFSIGGQYVGDAVEGTEFLFYDGHTGYDYPVPDGTSVVAARGGEVEIRNPDNLNEREIIVHHQHSYTTHYLHLSSVNVPGGEQVVRGQLLGTTGLGHLHFTVKRNGDRIDPYGWGRADLEDPYLGTGTNNFELWAPDVIFQDGFETGNASAWSAVTP